jgi:hypothetical protein
MDDDEPRYHACNRKALMLGTAFPTLGKSERLRSVVGHSDSCATANAVSGAVRGLASRLPLGPPKMLAIHG